MNCKAVLETTLMILLLVAPALSLAKPVKSFVLTGAEGEKQIITPGTLRDDLFPEWSSSTGWERESVTFGFTAYGEMVTDQDPYKVGSKYGVGLTYPSVGPNASEHIATPSSWADCAPYTPIEGWQLYWKWTDGTRGSAIDPWWHLSMAIYGNWSAPMGSRARLDVKLPEELGYGKGSFVITNTSRLFALRTHFYTYNETLMTKLGLHPIVFEIELTYVFFKNTKKIVQFWTIQYLKSEYGPVDVVFRRMTRFTVDQKPQKGENEGFAVFFPTSWNESAVSGCHAFWTGCEYWPQNYSLALAWTNASILHWDPVDAPHHIGFVAYYPNCSNWDTDDWNHFVTNIHTQGLLTSEGLGRRYQGQPLTMEFRPIDSSHFTGANLLMGQWNFTLTSATAGKMAQFVTVYGIASCAGTFGYVGSKYSDDWDSTSSNGHRTISEIKYMLCELFNASYKLSSESLDQSTPPLYKDMSNWYPFSGWYNQKVTWDPRNTTFIIGHDTLHYGSWCTTGPANTIDVIGATEVGEGFGSVSRTTYPLWCTLLDTEAFKPLGTLPYYRNIVGLTGWSRFNIITPTGYNWSIIHSVNVGGPKVNLATEYFNEHTWAVWTSAESGCEIPELADGGIYVLPSGNCYAGDGYSVITVVDDLNLDDRTTKIGADGSVVVEPYAGLCVWGVSGWDTRAACNWLAHYWPSFHDLFTNATAGFEKRGATTIILNTFHLSSTCLYGWDYGIQEILGPVVTRWRLSTTAWGMWMSFSCSIDWKE